MIPGRVAVPTRSPAQPSLLRRVPRIGLYAVLVAWAIIAFYPVVWTFLSSFKTPVELFQNPFGLPANWSFDNYARAWTEAKMGQFFGNSVVIAVGATALGGLLSSTLAFVFARFQFKGSRLVWLLLMVGFLVPASTRLVPLIVFTRWLGIYGTQVAIILVLAVTMVPFSVFFLRAYMEALPRELEEAAVVDGARMGQVFLRVIVPLSIPALATLSIFNFLAAWNEYTLVVLLSQSDTTFTLPVGLQYLASTFTNNQPGISAGLMVTIIPVLLAFLFFQRYIIRGVTAGALKG